MSEPTKHLGKIESVYFGLGGYQDCMLGLHVSLRYGDCLGSDDNKSAWDSNLIKHSDHCQWTEQDRSRQYDEILRYVSDLLAQAKVDRVEKLKGIPVEVISEGLRLKSWRILTEVL